MRDMSLRTPETHPDHETVGRFFVGLGGLVYYCDSYDPHCGFWMTNIHDVQDRRNVSERAIGRTYHQVYSFEDGKRRRLGIDEETADRVVAQVRPLWVQEG